MQKHLDEPVDLDGDVGDWLYSFEEAMAEVRRRLVLRYPEEHKLLLHKRNPAASLAYFVYADFESKSRRKMTVAVNRVGEVPSFHSEHSLNEL